MLTPGWMATGRAAISSRASLRCRPDTGDAVSALPAAAANAARDSLTGALCVATEIGGRRDAEVTCELHDTMAAASHQLGHLS